MEPELSRSEPSPSSSDGWGSRGFLYQAIGSICRFRKAPGMSRGSAVRIAALCGLAGLATASVVALAGPAAGEDATAARGDAAATTWSEGYCPDDTGVTVVVDFQELGGGTLVRCALGAQATGLDALKNAGFTVTGTVRWGDAFVCRIDGKPGPDTEPCVNTPPASAYWSYWHASNGGAWEYSAEGATNRTPPQGSFEGWSFAKNRTPDDVPPPRVDPVRPPAAGSTVSRERSVVSRDSTVPRERSVTSHGPGPASSAATNPHGAGAVAAARWLSGELVDGTLPGFAGTDWGLTLDALFALQASGADPDAAQQIVSAMSHNVRSYISFDDFGIPDVRIAGAAAKVLVAAVAAGADPRDFGGFDLRQEVLDLMAGPQAGADFGRIKDKGTADSSNTFAQSLAVIGLARSGGVPQPAVDFLIRQQCAAGGFRLSPDVFGAPSASCDESPDAVLDPDSTAMAVQALEVAAKSGAHGASEAAERGADWLEQIQKPDGSFGGSGPTAAPNSNSTGLAGQALAAAGRTESADRAADYIAGLQLTADNAGAASAEVGAIAYDDASKKQAAAGGISAPQRDQWRRSTAQALLALAKVPFGELGEGGEPASTPVDELARYLVDNLVDGNHVEVTFGGQSFVDYGQTADVGYALLLSGQQPEALDRVLAFLSTTESVDAYVHGVPFDKPGARYAGPAGKLAFLMALAGRNPRAVGGFDLVSELLGLQGADGRFADDSDFGDNANVFGQSFGVLALTAAGQSDAAGRAAQALLSARCADDTFPVDFPGQSSCSTGVPDSTGLAVQALDAGTPDATGLDSQRQAALVAAVRALEHSRDDDGAWSGPGGQNVNSTGYAAMGLLAVGQQVDHTRDWLASLQGDDGGLPLNPGQAANLLASAQGLPALAGTSFLTGGGDLVKPVIEVPAESSQPGTGTPNPPTPHPTAPHSPDSPLSPPDSGTLPVQGSDTKRAGGTLANTGAPVTTMLLVGLAMVSVGYGLHRAGRRRPEEVS